MRRFSGLMLLSILLTAPAYTQTPPQPTTALPTSAQAVVVDVVVQDKDGHPVHGLKLEDFHLTDNGIPQTIHTLAEHSTAEHSTLAPAAPGPAFAPLPPGTFTDYTPIPPNTTLNILLLDALNTRTSDQNFIRHQLQQYVQHADPGTRIAIFGLANRLTLLQDFTSNPTTLRDVVEHKLIARSSALLDHPTSTNASQPPSSGLATPPASSSADSTGPSAIELAANLRQFESRTGGLETEFRVQLTLDAFNTLAHYLAAFPGRKNLLWFSGSFPLNFHSVDAKQVDAQEFNETTNLLTRARVAIYPLDARGLMAQPNSSHARASNSAPRNPHSSPDPTPETLAADTGGHAFYPTNNLATTVAQAIDAGANDYTLTYNPTPPKDDGAYHSILISLTNSAPGLQLAYRRGYFAANASSPADAGRATAYQHAVMSRGAPAPQALLFKVRVLPASTALETTLAPDNQLDPSVPAKGPFRRYDLDSIALPNQLTLTPQPDGSRSAAVEFLAYVFDADGRLLNATGKTLRFTATPANYSRLMHSLLRCHLELSVPDQMQTFLRIAVHDLPSNTFGVIELPTSTVSNLPQAVYRANPAPPPATPPPATGHPTPPQR